jgi:2,3-bisphosphoglycerate-independent phosphoglycerate mutase
VLDESGRVLGRMTVNDVRLDLGENPATHLWLWGGGRFYQPARRTGALCSNSRMAAGLARLLGMQALGLRDPWSDDAADTLSNVETITAALDAHEFVAIHVEAPREPGDYGAPREKVGLLERLDLTLLAPLLKLVEARAPGRIVLTADNHLAPPGAEPASRVPVAVWRHGVQLEGAARWDEQACRSGAMGRMGPEDVFEALRGEL